jgi:hypothetical protein
MILQQLPENAFFRLGLLQCHAERRVNNTCCLRTNQKSFKDSYYYACPKTVHGIFIAIQNPNLGDKRIVNPRPTCLLLASWFLKKYPTTHDLAGFGKCTEKTANTRSWKYVEAIQALKQEQKVS